MGQRKAKLGRVTDVDLRLLRIFQTVVDCGGLSAAEIDLGIGRSTISTHIAELEGRLGWPLVPAGPRGVRTYEPRQDHLRSLPGTDEVTGRLSQ